MPRNVNPWVSELLGWHGQDRGGVRVPFQAGMGKPLGNVVSTPLIGKLRKLANDVTAGTPGTPRWIFLIGGPGNGKSEAVEAFIRELDSLANAQGRLTGAVKEKFVPDPVTPRRVELSPSDLESAQGLLRDEVRRLILIQDASAVDSPDQNAEEELIADLGDLFTSPVGQEPLLICCANRGLIARARSAIQSKATHQWLNVPQITELLTQLLTATGLGPSALTVSRPRCWPLENDARFAAWPLDLDTITHSEPDPSPVEQMLRVAVDARNWQSNGCSDCTSKELCPFYVNASMMQNDEARRKLLGLLRHGEMATGQRWNFRDAFSLCAELLIGQRDDFFNADSTSQSPCAWVHERVDEITLGARTPAKLAAAWDLVFHLYAQALFPVWPDPADELDPRVVQQSQLTKTLVQKFQLRRRHEGTQVRYLLAGSFSAMLDPARATPPANQSLLRLIEDEFGQSISQGLENYGGRLPSVVRQLLELMAQAEGEWSETVRESGKARTIIETLRVLSSTLVKRSLGVQEGEYLNLEYLREYEALLRDQGRIRAIVSPLRTVLAPGGLFAGSLVRVFGQPTPKLARDVLVTYRLGSIVPRVASTPSEDRPGHDVPWIEVEGERIALTFDLFTALRLGSMGAEMASFPPHTRAAIDKVRNAIAGRLSRDKESMLGGGVSIKVGAIGHLAPGGDGNLEFRDGEGGI